MKLKLKVLDNRLSVCRLESDESVPEWLDMNGDFISVTKTKDELSIVCDENIVPEGTKNEKGWRALKVEGPLDFSLTGILESLAAPLAQNQISIFAISTFDTDYILVKEKNLEKAKKMLGKFCTVLV